MSKPLIVIVTKVKDEIINKLHSGNLDESAIEDIFERIYEKIDEVVYELQTAVNMLAGRP